MVYYKTKEEIELIRQSCLLVCKALSEVGSILKPGITGLEIDQVAETVIRDHGAVPGFKGYNGFPAPLCVSVNEQVVHGIPTETVFKDGDIVSVDCGVFRNDFFGDSAYTFPIGEVSDDVLQLLKTLLRCEVRSQVVHLLAMLRFVPSALDRQRILPLIFLFLFIQ